MRLRRERVDPVAAYRRRLDRALRSLPPRERERLREEIRAHLDDSLPTGSGPREVARALAALGSPEAIVAAARGDRGADPARPSGTGALASLAWVMIGILAELATSASGTPELGAALLASFLTVAVLVSLLGRHREAAPLFLVGAGGLRSGLLLWGVVQAALTSPGLVPAFFQGPRLWLDVPSVLGFAIGLGSLVWLGRAASGPHPWVQRSAPRTST